MNIRNPLLRRVISAWDSFFNDSWRLIPFQPILYLFILGASIRLWVNQGEPPSFETIIARGTYGIWLFLGVTGPLVSLLSWWMIRHSGRIRFLGFWARLSSDVMVFTAVLSYHIVTAITNRPLTESRIFARYLIGAILIFTLALIIRDLAAIVLVERVARRIHRGDKDG